VWNWLHGDLLNCLLFAFYLDFMSDFKEFPFFGISKFLHQCRIYIRWIIDRRWLHKSGILRVFAREFYATKTATLRVSGKY
jgi:hypothetical protein